MARDTSALMGILFDELDALRAGTADPRRSAAVARLAQQIISTAKVEMDYHKLAMRAKAHGEQLVLGAMDLSCNAERAVESGKPSAAIEHRGGDGNATSPG